MTQDALGYLSLGWFIWLMFARYDHYGKVCTGDHLSADEESTFVNLIKAGRVLHLYIRAIWACVLALFWAVLVYSCCAAAHGRRAEPEDED